MFTINDPGGLVGFHILLGKSLAAKGVMLKVVYCVSACLIMLQQVPKSHICVTPDAWFGYHTKHQHKDGTEDPTTMRWERGTVWIKRGYKACY